MRLSGKDLRITSKIDHTLAVSAQWCDYHRHTKEIHLIDHGVVDGRTGECSISIIDACTSEVLYNGTNADIMVQIENMAVARGFTIIDIAG